MIQDPHLTGFVSKDDAAKHIFTYIKQKYPDYVYIEYGGVIYYNRNDNLYYVSFPQRGDRKEVYISFKLKMEHTLVGMYHNHPHTPNSRYFSTTDRETAYRHQLDSYLLDSYNDIQVLNGSNGIIRILK